MSSLGWESQSRGLAGGGTNVGALLGELPCPVTGTGPTLSPGHPLLRAGQPPGGISGHTDGQGVGMKGRPHGWCGAPTPARPGSSESALGGGRLSGGLPAAQPCPAEGSWGLGSGGRDCRGGRRALRQWDHFYKTEHTCPPPQGWARGEDALLHTPSFPGRKPTEPPHSLPTAIATFVRQDALLTQELKRAAPKGPCGL